MKIESVQTIPVSYPEPNDHDAQRHLCLVRIRSDDGQVGWGEAVTMWPEASQATRAIVEGLSALLIGQDPVESERLWRSMKSHSWWYGLGGIASFAISALDIAIWDLKGKALASSVVDLLGGVVHDRLPAMCSMHASHGDLERQADEIAEWLAPGLHGVKVGFGKRGEARLGYGHDRDVEFMRVLRRAIGPDKRIMIDIGTTVQWDVTAAIERCRAMEEHGLYWIEEPIGHDNPEGYTRLRDAVTTRIAYGEREWNTVGYQRVLDTGTVDVVGFDPGRAEGITGFQKVCEQVELAHREANAHAWSSAIVTAASLAVSFSSPVFRQFEVKPLRNPMQHDLVTNPIDHQDGWMLPPSGPGLGIEVREDVVDHYRVPSVTSVH
jgi:L-alanine-DL-glutamate epimerase-like enolase superfamily enzyme